MERVGSKTVGGTAIGDIGVYPLQLMSLVFGGRTPKKIVAVGHLNSDGEYRSHCVQRVHL